MDWWNISIEARTDGPAEIDDDTKARFLDLTQPYDGTITTDEDPPRWAATVSLEAAGAPEAVAEATRLVVELAADAGLPIWPVIRAAAVREDAIEDDAGLAV